MLQLRTFVISLFIIFWVIIDHYSMWCICYNAIVYCKLSGFNAYIQYETYCNSGFMECLYPIVWLYMRTLQWPLNLCHKILIQIGLSTCCFFLYHNLTNLIWMLMSALMHLANRYKFQKNVLIYIVVHVHFNYDDNDYPWYQHQSSQIMDCTVAKWSWHWFQVDVATQNVLTKISKLC